MYSKPYGLGDGYVYGSVRPYLYSNPMRPKKCITKTRTAASRIVKILKKFEEIEQQPLCSLVVTGKPLNLNSDNEQSISEDKVDQHEAESRNEFDNGQNAIEGDGGVEFEVEKEQGRQQYNLPNRAEVQGGRQRYNLRNRADVRKLSVQEGKKGTKVTKDVKTGRSRLHKRHRPTRTADSDDFFQASRTSSKGGADIQPLHINGSVSFDDIGGLSEYIDSLKEMVLFPLLYPELFASFDITPPRGVLFCGPPGTGKTLVARALACAASKGDQKVSFYMRKGADVLSKWVGESENQLKLLFEEAQSNQPSIIFFDEIDGLAPARSSKQEQIHNSIVSTLLALMDGLDSRGQVVLIGATNRVDEIDGALRRPGRFDREFNFSLPGCEARAEILHIHTRKWKQPPSRELKYELAASCVGFCGADLKALCTEATIRAFREKCPQVYSSGNKCLIDIDSIKVEKCHFTEAMSTITPAAQRGSIVHSRPLPLVVAPCLQRHLQKAMKCISDIFPPFTLSSEWTKLRILSHRSPISLIYRPRLLLCGSEGTGVDHLGPAILHQLEKFPIHSLGLAALLSDRSAKSPEDALVHIFGEARRKTPSVLYIPQFNLLWNNANDQLRVVLLSLLEELPSDLPILLLGTSSVVFKEVEGDPSSVFPRGSIYEMEKPSTGDRSLFCDHLLAAAVSVLTKSKSSNEVEAYDANTEMPSADGNGHEAFGLTDDVTIHEAENVKQRFVERTNNYGIPQLARLHASIMKGIFEFKDGDDPNPSLLKFLSKFDEF